MRVTTCMAPCLAQTPSDRQWLLPVGPSFSQIRSSNGLGLVSRTPLSKQACV